MAVVLGLAVALTYGTGDFLGGLASRRNDTMVVVVLSQAVGLVMLTALAATVGGGRLWSSDLAWGVLAGLSGLVGLLAFYRALAEGTMSVVAPVTAVGSAVVPVTAGLAAGERPGALALLGVVVALVAVALVARGQGGTATRMTASELVLSMVAGVGFGAFFVFAGQAGDDSGLWPLVAARLASITVVTVLLVRRGGPLRPTSGTGAAVVATGLFDSGSNALFLLAAREGLLSLVGVISSLYPAMTVVLATVVLRERLALSQVVGLILALLGVAFIAAA